MDQNQKDAKEWFLTLRNNLVSSLEKIEGKCFSFKNWDHAGSGGGTMGSLKGNIVEKGGVNISTVSGTFSDEMRSRIPGTEQSADYWATGISIVIHPFSPLIPSMHFNSRYLKTGKSWFGGGMDITPAIPFVDETKHFHSGLKSTCDIYDSTYYEKHKKWCDEYFFLKHRNETRGVGGVFFDYINTENFINDFSYTQAIGNFFFNYVEYIFEKYAKNDWTDEQKRLQMIKRGRYVEFNLLYDRGTKFGLETGGNTEAILMSMPPVASWD
jgi:coproporphyrinogen III oxidase